MANGLTELIDNVYNLGVTPYWSYWSLVVVYLQPAAEQRSPA